MHTRIDARSLTAALRTTRRLARGVRGAAGWIFDHGTLTLEWAGTTQTLRGEGHGEGSVRVEDADMRRLGEMPARKGMIDVTFADGWLRIGTFSFNAQGRVGAPGDVPHVPQLLALNPSLRHLVALPYLHSSETIAAADLANAAASARRDRELRTERAARVLEPLGIKPEALSAWIDAHLGAIAGSQ